MAVQRTLTCLAATALLMQLAMAANYTVGGPNGGWDATTDLQTWGTSQSFSVGDILIFQYTAASHSVLEVNKAAYDSCQTGNAIQSHNDGNTVITLSSPGKRYYICGAPGHCAGGMKVEIDTLATSSPPASSPTTSPPRASPSTPTPAASPSTPPSHSPVSSPEISSPSPARSPKTAPTMFPASPSSSPSGSLPPPSVTSTEPSTTAPPPGSSSATKGVSKTTVTMAFSLGMLMLLAL